MFAEKYNEKKLKVNLKLAVQRLKLVEKKKTEVALRARKEIADYLRIPKVDRARIRVEHIIREDCLVEALEIVEMQLDLLEARIALISQSKQPHPSIIEAVHSVLWAYPLISGECPELKIINDQLTKKFGKQMVAEIQNAPNPHTTTIMDQHKTTVSAHINKKLAQRLDPSAPEPWIIETYLEAIADAFKVPFEADPAIKAAGKMHPGKPDADLIQLQQMGEFGPTSGNLPPSGFQENQGGFQGNQGGHYPTNGQGGHFQQQPQSSQPVKPTAPSTMIQKPKSSFNYPSMTGTSCVKQPDQSTNSNSGPLDATYSPFPQQYDDVTVPTQQPPSPGDFDYGRMTSGAYMEDKKRQAAEQPYTGNGEQYKTSPPPNYSSYGIHHQQETPAEVGKEPTEEDYDFDLPSIPVNSYDQNNNDNSGGDDEFDDLEARFRNLKKP